MGSRRRGRVARRRPRCRRRSAASGRAPACRSRASAAVTVRSTGDADGCERGRQQVRVGVGKDGEPPAALTQLGKSRGHLREDGPARQRLGERVLVLGRQHEPLALGEEDERLAQNIPVRKRALELHARLDLVVALEQVGRVGVGPEARQLGADAAVPVHERPVAVERRPAHGRDSTASRVEAELGSLAP